MPDMILHHYMMSPYARKIRTMYGYTDFTWQSCITREMPPREAVDILAGGYGRIPVAQIGADIFCDSSLIAIEIAEQSGRKELALPNVSEEERHFVSEVEGDIFFACVMTGAGMKMNKKAMQTLSFLDGMRLLLDRVKMGRSARIKMPKMRNAKSITLSHLKRLEEKLSNSDKEFIFGSSPSIADFATYHSLWFVRDLGERPYLKKYPTVEKWMDKMKNFGEGNRSDISTDQALELAAISTPRMISPDYQKHASIGKMVTVTPTDYRLVSSKGKLVGVSPNSYIIAREHPKVNTVHVHFPQQGYDLNATG